MILTNYNTPLKLVHLQKGTKTSHLQFFLSKCGVCLSMYHVLSSEPRIHVTVRACTYG